MPSFSLDLLLTNLRLDSERYQVVFKIARSVTLSMIVEDLVGLQFTNSRCSVRSA